MRWPTRTKVFVVILALGLGMAFVFLNLGFFKSIYRHYKKPKLYEAKRSFQELSGPTIHKDLKVFAASSLDRIFQDGHTLVKPTYSTSVSISAAGNEYESFQIVVDSLKDIPAVFIESSDFINDKTKEVIAYENVKWRIVGYVPTQKPYYPVKFVGPWPDPLIPKESYDIKAQVTQPFWITIYVPPHTPAGDYKGTVTLHGKGISDQVIPVNLHVYDFSLTKESHLKTAFDFYEYLTKARYPKGSDESEESYKQRLEDINDQFISMMIDYRMNPILNIDPTSNEDLNRISRYIGQGLNSFAIGKKGGTFNNNWPKDNQGIEDLLPLYHEYGQALKENHLLSFSYIYTWDEGEIGNPLVPKIASMIHRAYPGLKNMVCYHGFWDPLVNPDWGKDIDIWTFQIDDFDEKRMHALQDHGMEIWMYVSGPSSNETPNLVMDFDAIYYRIIPWMCWKYDIKGFLYWCVNWWPKADPFTDAKNTEWEQNANGLLFYPGDNGPIASLRAEIFRDGMEDYEYIQILIEKLRWMKAQDLDSKHKQLFDKSLKVLTMDSSIISSPKKFTKDGQYLQSRRNAIAQRIEEFDRLFPLPK